MPVCSVAQSCLTLYDPMHFCLQDFSVHGISWARILKWVAISSSRGSSQPKDRTRVSCISCIGRQILYYWTTHNLSIENYLLTFYVSGYVPWTIYMWIMVLVCVLNHFSLVQLFATLWTVACHAPLSMGFSREEYWSGLPCPLPGDILEPGIELVSCFSCITGRLYPLSNLGSLWIMVVNIKEHFHIM